MKKVSIGLFVILSCIAANSLALPNIRVPSLPGGLAMGLNYMYGRLAIPHLDYAIRYPDLVPINPDVTSFSPFDVIFENGRYQSEQPEHDWYFRANVGYIFPCTGNDALVAYTSLDHDDTEFDNISRVDTIIIPTLITGTENGIFIFPDFEFNFDTPFVETNLFFIFAFFDDGSTVGGPPINIASAKSDFRYKAWDLEFGQYLNVGCNTNLRFYAGLRQANLVSRFDATYFGFLNARNVTDAIRIFEPTVEQATLSMNETVITHQKSDFEGGGPRVGTQATYDLCGGFHFIAEISTALLVGQIDSSFQKAARIEANLREVVNLGGGVVVTQINNQQLETLESFRCKHTTRVIPNLEGKIGFGYTFHFCNCSRSSVCVEGGYMLIHYYNNVDRLSEIGKTSPEFRSRNTLDTSLDGPYVNLQVQI